MLNKRAGSCDTNRSVSEGSLAYAAGWCREIAHRDLASADSEWVTGATLYISGGHR